MIDPLNTEIQTNLDSFLTHTKCWFHPRDMWSEYNINSEESKQFLRDELASRVLDGVLEHEGQKYRLIDLELREIDWFGADEEDYIRINLPFNLGRYVKLYPGLVVIAGEKGKGKSAWMMDCIFKNISDVPQYYFVNDARDVELKDRFLSIVENKNMPLPEPHQLKVYERYGKFGDVIVRDGINYVDYLDVNTDFYSIGQEMDDIHKATGNGITFVAIQKNPKEKIGLGGIFSWKKTQLYITLSEPLPPMDDMWKGVLKLVRTRGMADPRLEPEGRKWHYDIFRGFEFSVETGEGK